jgi:hypothetical protein
MPEHAGWTGNVRSTGFKCLKKIAGKNKEM